jgi:hypothetical protein
VFLRICSKSLISLNKTSLDKNRKVSKIVHSKNSHHTSLSIAHCLFLCLGVYLEQQLLLIHQLSSKAFQFWCCRQYYHNIHKFMKKTKLLIKTDPPNSCCLLSFCRLRTVLLSTSYSYHDCNKNWSINDIKSKYPTCTLCTCGSINSTSVTCVVHSICGELSVDCNIDFNDFTHRASSRSEMYS